MTHTQLVTHFPFFGFWFWSEIWEINCFWLSWKKWIISSHCCQLAQLNVTWNTLPRAQSWDSSTSADSVSASDISCGCPQDSLSFWEEPITVKSNLDNVVYGVNTDRDSKGFKLCRETTFKWGISVLQRLYHLNLQPVSGTLRLSEGSKVKVRLWV